MFGLCAAQRHSMCVAHTVCAAHNVCSVHIYLRRILRIIRFSALIGVSSHIRCAVAARRGSIRTRLSCISNNIYSRRWLPMAADPAAENNYLLMAGHHRRSCCASITIKSGLRALFERLFGGVTGEHLASFAQAVRYTIASRTAAWLSARDIQCTQ